MSRRADKADHASLLALQQSNRSGSNRVSSLIQPDIVARVGSASRGQDLHREGVAGATRHDGMSLLHSPVNQQNFQALLDSRKNSFSAPDEVLLDRKGSGENHIPYVLDRTTSSIEGHSNWLAHTQKSMEPGKLLRPVLDKPVAASLATANSLSRGTSRLAAESKVPDWLSSVHTRTPSLPTDTLVSHLSSDAYASQASVHNSAFEADTSATLAHLDQQQAQVHGSLQQLHTKLDSVASALGVALSDRHSKAGLISALHGSEQQEQQEQQEVQQQMDSLISQVEATLQQPDKPPATAKASRTDSSSIGTAVQRQLDLVTEQLAAQGSITQRGTSPAQLAVGVSNIDEQLRLAQQATQKAQQSLTNSTQLTQQDSSKASELLQTTERALVSALGSSGNLQQLLRMHVLGQPSKSSQTLHEPSEPMAEQLRSLLDNVLHGTYTSLREEFQSDVTYKGSEIGHVIKAVMRKQVSAGQQALLDLASPAPPQAASDS